VTSTAVAITSTGTASTGAETTPPGYLCVGLAIGRLDLGSPRVAWWLLGGGLALAVVSRAVSVVVLYRLGGCRCLSSCGYEA
jgi:hypothetical protein